MPLRALHERLDDPIGVAALDQQPRSARADLARVVEGREQRAGDRLVDVGVGEDDVRGLAAQLEVDALDVLRGRSQDRLAGRRSSPVNVSFGTCGWATSAAPVVGPSPWTMLNTPAGMPASSVSGPSSAVDSGVCSAIFSTIELPTASAGAVFQHASRNG